jgi:integrase
MPTIKLTKTAVQNLKAPDPSGKQKLYFDSDLKGFAVLCSGTSNAKSFIVQRDISGKTRRITIGATNVFDVDKAREKAIGALLLMHQGTDPKAVAKAARQGGITLREAFEEFLTVRHKLRASSRKNYREALAHLESWLDQPLRDIDYKMVEARHREIAKDIRKRYKGATGTAAANFTMRVLRLVWNFIADRYKEINLPANPVRLKDQWFDEKRRTGLVSNADLPAFWRAVQGLENEVQRDYFVLLLFTGLRREEAASLTWENINFSARTIMIPAARTKGKRDLTLPMSDIVHDMLMARRKIGRTDFVFPSCAACGYISEPRYPLRLIAKASGVEITPHDLRRTFLTVAESLDIGTYALKAMVNHSTRDDLTGGYVQVTVDRLREPVQRAADRLKMLCEIVCEENVAA